MIVVAQTSPNSPGNPTIFIIGKKVFPIGLINPNSDIILTTILK